MEHVTEDCTCEGKLCTKCQELRCVGNYTKDKRLKSGLKSQCRVCSSKENRAWRQNNQEYNRSRKNEWNNVNRNKVNERSKQHYHNNPGVYQQIKQHRQEDLEKYRESIRDFRKKHPERIKVYTKRYRKKHPELYRSWMKSNPGKGAAYQAARRAIKTQAGGSYTVQEWEALKAQYDYTCLCCGRREPAIKLTADHVIPITKLGSSNIDNIQPLCFSCNSSKNTKIIDYRKTDLKTLDNSRRREL